MSLRKIINEKSIIMVPGAYDATSAEIIEREGFDIVYISGLANEEIDIGMPDLGFTTATKIVWRTTNIVEVVDVPDYMWCRHRIWKPIKYLEDDKRI